MPLKMTRRRFAGLSVAAAASVWVRPALGETHEATAFVNPLIGASTSQKLGGGKTFPGPTTPFGLVQLSPDTITGGDNAPGYSYEHASIEGFSFTHMSGVGWYGDFGNLLTMKKREQHSNCQTLAHVRRKLLIVKVHATLCLPPATLIRTELTTRVLLLSMPVPSRTT